MHGYSLQIFRHLLQCVYIDQSEHEIQCQSFHKDSEELKIVIVAEGNATSGFVETFGVGLCRGQYADALAAEWHRWNQENTSENDPVSNFGKDQLYVVFVVADGGRDLEHIDLRNFAEARSLLLQVLNPNFLAVR